MERRFNLALIGAFLGVFAALLLAASPAGAATNPKFIVECTFSHQSKNDPIVFPRERGRAHLHHFFGNRTTNHRSTPRKLRRKRRTTCDRRADHSAYWIPALFVRGQVIKPELLLLYYTAGWKDPQSVRPFPKGLRMIAGSAMATAPQPRSLTSWACRTGYISDLTAGLSSGRAKPACPRGAKLVLTVVFPDCWNGKNLDSADHKSHMAYSPPGSMVLAPVTCPASHPIPVPQLRMIFVYPTNGASSGVELASGGIYSAHADFMNGWQQGRLRSLTERCIQRARPC